MPFRFLATTVVAFASLAAVASASAEIVVLDCKPYKHANVCPSHWVIDGEAKTVTWHWCKSPDTTEQRDVVITQDKITFSEEFMSRHYEFDRKTGRMTITAVALNADGEPGERFKDPAESVCKPAK